MRITLASLFVLCLASQVSAQDTLWVANRNSNTLSRLQPWGLSAQTVSTATSLRRMVQAPDGKLWVIRFIQTSFDIYNADGTLFTTVLNPSGSAYDVAFDKFGHAWVTGGTQAHEYDANGVLVNSYVLGAAAPLGISIDMDGNKWIAHRVSPGKLTKIDTLGVVSPPFNVNATAMQPVVVLADYRGVGVSSHIWVIGDSSGLVAEFDVTGTQLNTYSSTLTSISAMAQDPISTDLFIGSFGSGLIARMTTAGVVTGTINNAPSCLGLNFDSFGRLWSTTRLASPALSEMRRWDINTNTLEMVTPVGLGTQSPISTRHDYALIVDPLGDADGDGTPNNAEILLGTSPWDAQSTPFASINTTGQTASNATFNIATVAPFGSSTAIAASGLSINPGIPFGGISGSLLLDPVALFLDPITGSPILFTVSGPGSIPLTIPPAVGGLSLFIQALTIDTGGAQFTNLTGLFVYV